MAADIHALEIEFAKNPSLEACIPLCEAYLAQKRYMEAMVVCKKGIKQAPQDARGRVVLARVYAAQGKAPKAQAELEQLLRDMPGNPLGLEALGRVLLEQGRGNEGVVMLQQALAADPGRADARMLLQQAGVATAPAAAAQAMPAPGAAVRPTPRQGPPAMPGQPRQFAATQPPQFNAGAGASQPGFNPPGLPGQRPQAMPNPALQPAAPYVAPTPVAEPARPLEHVHDFFAPETLGFSHDNADIETAGPGRLTILGFVPKNTGSIKTTVYIALGVLAIAGAIILYQYRSSVTTREINKKYGELKAAMDEDKLGRYEDAVRRGNEILTIDKSHNLTLGALAYVHAILAVDFQKSDSAPLAKEFLRQAMKSSGEETEYRVAARALLSFADGQLDQGVADIKKILDRGGSSPLVELEAFRLMAAAKPNDKETQVELRRLLQLVTSQARIYNFLGWYYYMQDDWALADKNFASALQNVRGHPRAMIGQALADFDRGIALRERQKEIAGNVKATLALPAEDLDNYTMALAHFANGQLLQWQGKQPEADAEYGMAFKLDAQNPIMYYRRGTGLLNLSRASEAVEPLRKAAAMQPNNLRFYRTLADAQMRAGDSAGAKATLDRAIQMNPADAEMKVLEGNRLLGDRQYAQAIDMYKLIKKDDGGPILAKAAMGISTALREGGKKAEAIKYMEDFLAAVPADVLQPEQAKLWCELGLDYDSTKSFEHAERWYQQGIETYRYEPDCHYYLCKLLGRGEEAKEACKAYLALAPRGRFAEDASRRAGVK